MGGGFPFTGAKGKMTISEVTDKKLCGNFDVMTTKVITRAKGKIDTVSFNGKFEGYFCL